MYNFYTLNPNHQTSAQNPSSSISLDVNQTLTNTTFYKLFSEYYHDNTSEEKQDRLAQHLNTINYLIAFTGNNSVTDINSLKTITINSKEDLNLLICTTEEREVYLPAFTDTSEIIHFTNEPIFTLTVPAKWLWKFILSQKNFNGIVFNPGTIGWDISLEHIQSLLDDINTDSNA